MRWKPVLAGKRRIAMTQWRSWADKLSKGKKKKRPSWLKRLLGRMWNGTFGKPKEKEKVEKKKK